MRDRALPGRLYDKRALQGLAIFACTGPFQQFSKISKMMQMSSLALFAGWEAAQKLYLQLPLEPWQMTCPHPCWACHANPHGTRICLDLNCAFCHAAQTADYILASPHADPSFCDSGCLLHPHSLCSFDLPYSGRQVMRLVAGHRLTVQEDTASACNLLTNIEVKACKPSRGLLAAHTACGCGRHLLGGALQSSQLVVAVFSKTGKTVPLLQSIRGLQYLTLASSLSVLPISRESAICIRY